MKPSNRSLGSVAALFALAATPSALYALEAAAVINEIQYNPAAPGDPEWIELTNKLSVDVDLTGWRLTGGANFDFPAGTTLRAGGYLVISDNPAALQTAASITGVLGPWTGSLNNSGETLRLRDLSGRLMDEVTYNDRGRWPSGADGSGATLARKSGHVSGRTADSWALSRRVGGSPGAGNEAVQLAPAVTLFNESAPWLYQDTSAGLGAGWQNTAYTAGTGGWLSGAGVLAFEDAVLPAPVGTVLATPATHPTGTYYFQKTFLYNSGNPATAQFNLHALLDDGAVVYLNGTEVARRGMPSSAITATTASTAEAGNAVFTDITIPGSAVVSGTNTISVEVHQAGRPIIPGGTSSGPLTLVQTNGTIMTTNYCRQAGAVAFAKDVLPAPPSHTIPHVNDGVFGNSNSWIGNTLNSFCGVSFGATAVNIGSVAWGRDNTGGYTDRSAGTYTLEYTTVPNPNETTTAWTLIGTVNYPGNGSTYSVRHVYSFTAVNATGIRLTCPGSSFADGAAVDELEAGPYIAPPPPPAPVFKLMATGGTLDPATNMGTAGTAFAKDVLTGYPAHSIPHLNDGIYGNSNSWIGNSTNSFAGISFPSLRSIGRIAWGRDNTGGFVDRAEGAYTVQYTTVLNPTAATPDASWTTIGSITLDAALGSPPLRHVLEFTPVNAAGIRIIAPGTGVGSGACIDELEIYPAVAPDVVWGASMTVRDAIAPPSALPLVINEIGGSLDGTWRVELKNTGSTPLAIGGLVLAGSDAPLAGLTLPAQTLNPGAVLVLDETQLGFRPGEDDRLFLYAPGRTGVVDSTIVRANGRARSADGKMLVPTAATFGAANTFSFTDAIVINEVMYHFPDSEEEWIELYNKTGAAVDVSGWRLDDAVTFTIPAATSIPAGGYLVISNNAPALRVKWPAAAIIGDFSGSLNNRGDHIALEDAHGNPVDEVTYAAGGKWPSLADGGGSSLELRDVVADHTHPASWDASDESGKSTMQTFTYRSVSTQPSAPSYWNELRLGMLDAGVCMVDDIRVTRDPDGAQQQLMTNGAFTSATGWRFIGNHETSAVVTDGANGSVLRLAASGPAETNHNHVETNFSTALVDGQTYEVSLRARWISGVNRLGVRGYYSRIGKALTLPIPQNLGTPGAANSRIAIAGPSLSALRHSPVFPAVSQNVTVSCQVNDARPVTGVTLNYGTGAGFTSVPMALSGGVYSATIPGQATAGTVVQFYVFAQNSAGGSSMLPAAGGSSRALYIVEDGQHSTIPAREMRVIMLAADSNAMFSTFNLLSNATRGGTLISGGTDIFYDVGVRLQGTAASRARDTPSSFRSFNVNLNADEPYLGLYASVGFDRSARTPVDRRPDEIYAKHLFHRAGLPATRDDLAYLAGPTTTYTGHCILQLNSYNGEFVDDMFNTEGSVFNYDITYDPKTQDAQFNKIPNLFDHFETDLRNLGTDKEQYRGFFDIRAGKGNDDYAPLMAMCQAMELTGTAFETQTNALIDVDQWMRCTALINLFTVGDSWYTGGLKHNARFFVPASGKAVQLPWDMDFMLSGGTSGSLNATNGNLSRLIALPANNRTYLAHIRDLCMTVLDPVYVQTWLTSYGTVTNHNYADAISWLSTRRSYALSQLPASVPFAITTNSGADFAVNAHTTTLTGTGWLDIRSIRRNGSTVPPVVRWTSPTAWQMDLALVPGANNITLDAVGFNGTVLTSDSIIITDNLPAPLPRDFLRITEVHYHPAAPTTAAELAVSTDDDEFEFIELQNTGTGPLDLTGVRFTDGIAFAFPNSTTLAGGAYILVVKNPAAFAARYGAGFNIAGSYPADNLSNSGETITLVDATGTIIQTFAYNDKWAPLSDGPGRSLVIRNPAAPVATWQTAAGWALSGNGGTPGASAGTNLYSEFALWRHAHFSEVELDDPVSGASADPRGEGVSNLMRYAFGLTPQTNALGFLPTATTSGGNLRIEFRRLKNALDVTYAVESSGDLTGWTPVAETPVVIGDNGDGTETVRVDSPTTSTRRMVHVKLALP